jgi:hypothetical protein
VVRRVVQLLRLPQLVLRQAAYITPGPGNGKSSVQKHSKPFAGAMRPARNK